MDGDRAGTQSWTPVQGFAADPAFVATGPRPLSSTGASSRAIHAKDLDLVLSPAFTHGLILAVDDDPLENLKRGFNRNNLPHLYVGRSPASERGRPCPQAAIALFNFCSSTPESYCSSRSVCHSIPLDTSSMTPSPFLRARVDDAASRTTPGISTPSTL